MALNMPMIRFIPLNDDGRSDNASEMICDDTYPIPFASIGRDTEKIRFSPYGPNLRYVYTWL